MKKELPNNAMDVKENLVMQTPIIDGIYRVLHEDANPGKTVEEVMSRELRPEVDAEMHVAASAKGNHP